MQRICVDKYHTSQMHTSRQMTEGPTVLTGRPNERVNEFQTRRFVPVLVHRAQILLNSLSNYSLVPEAGS